MEAHQQLIMIVEDDPLLRSVGKRQLAALGFPDVVLADTGEAALQIMNEQHPSLILMDVGLPGIDGAQTSVEIRREERRAQRARTPIIALTANSDKERCFEAGMDDYLQKPALLDDLRRVLTKWLNTPDSK